MFVRCGVAVLAASGVSGFTSSVTPQEDRPWLRAHLHVLSPVQLGGFGPIGGMLGDRPGRPRSKASVDRREMPHRTASTVATSCCRVNLTQSFEPFARHISCDS